MKRDFVNFIVAIVVKVGSAGLHTFSAVGSCCRFSPTCSIYCREAIEAHGIGRGILLAMKRLLRCGPWGQGGWDPIPCSGSEHELRKGI